MTWKLRECDSTKCEAIARAFGFPRSIAQVLVTRNYDTPDKVKEFIEVSLDQLGSPFQMIGMDRACERIVQAMEKGETILVHGDFDADGITASALLHLFFREIGVNAHVHIPNRLEERHGLSEGFVKKAVSMGAKLVITCDCGSSNAQEIQALQNNGIDTIVTDHHQVHEPLSNAILVNPNQAGEGQPGELSGVGVVFMVIVALRKTLRDRGYFAQRTEPNLRKFLDIVALGTIADMAPLVGFNRVLVVKGLQELGSTSRLGLLAMKENTGIAAGNHMHAYDVGFRLAPRINAAARLGYAMEAYEIMTSDHPLTVQNLSMRLEEWNKERKKIQERMVQVCQTEKERQLADREVLIFASKEFHPGVIGLTAQKMAAETGKPCFVFRIEEKVAKGSARCRYPYHLMDLMTSVKDLLLEFGGHREAGGCKLGLENFQEFAQRIQELGRKQRQGKEIHLWVDSTVDVDEIDDGFMKHLRKIGPFGPGHAEPIFQSTVTVVGLARQVGVNHLQAKIAGVSGRNYSCVAFDKWDSWKDRFQGKVHVYYYVQENVWKGQVKPSLQLQGFSPVS